MLNLNNVPEDTSSNQNDFELMPDNTIVRGIIKLSGGDRELPEFGAGQYFKSSQSGAEWLPIEVTIMGGPFDKRKVWHNIFVNGTKLNDNGVPLAKVIGLQMMKAMIDSAFNLDPKDQSPQAQQARSLQGVSQLNGLNFCFKIGIEKGQNGYSDRNKIKSVLTLGQNGYIPIGQASTAATPTAPQQMAQPAAQPMAQPAAPAAPTATATNGVVPSWAQ